MTASQIRMFAVGDNTYDQLNDIPATVSITTGIVTFDGLVGDSDLPISFTVTNTVGDTRVVDVNEVGIVDVN